MAYALKPIPAKLAVAGLTHLAAHYLRKKGKWAKASRMLNRLMDPELVDASPPDVRQASVAARELRQTWAQLKPRLTADPETAALIAQMDAYLRVI